MSASIIFLAVTFFSSNSTVASFSLKDTRAFFTPSSSSRTLLTLTGHEAGQVIPVIFKIISAAKRDTLIAKGIITKVK